MLDVADGARQFPLHLRHGEQDAVAIPRTGFDAHGQIARGNPRRDIGGIGRIPAQLALQAPRERCHHERHQQADAQQQPQRLQQ